MEIIRRAREHQTSSFGSLTEGVSEEELRTVSKELGIDSDSLNSALSNFDSAQEERNSGLFGGPFILQTEFVVVGTLGPAQFEEILGVMQQHFQEVGSTEKRENVVEWKGSSESVTLRQVGSTVRVSILSDHRQALVVYMFAVLADIMAAALMSKLGSNGFILSGLFTLVTLLLARHWTMKSTERGATTLRKCSEQIRSILQGTSDNSTVRSLVEPLTHSEIEILREVPATNG